MKKQGALRNLLSNRLAFKIGLPAAIATMIAVGISAFFVYEANRATSDINESVSLHNEAISAVKNMEKAALEQQHALYQIIYEGRMELADQFRREAAEVDRYHDLAYEKFNQAEAHPGEGSEFHVLAVDNLFANCEELHNAILEDFNNWQSLQVSLPLTVGREELFVLEDDLKQVIDCGAEMEAYFRNDLELANDKLAAARRTAGVMTFAGAGAALFVGLLIAYFSARRLVRPVKKMARAAASMTDGDLTQSVDVRGRDELARLSSSFNAMARALERRTRQLEYEKANIRSIHQSIGDGIVVFSRHGRITSVNPAAEAILGANAIDLEGKTDTGVAALQEELSRPPISRAEMARCWEVKSCTHPECPSYESSDLRCWLQCGTCCHNQIQGTFRQKRDACERCDVFKANAVREFELGIEGRYYSGVIIPILDDEGQDAGRTLVLHDITGMYKTKRELEQLQGLSEALSSTLALDKTLEAGVEAVAELEKFDAVCVYLNDRPGGTLEMAASRGFAGNVPPELTRLAGAEAPVRALGMDKPLVISDLRKETKAPDKVRASGMASAAMIPLRSAGQEALGVLCVARKKAGDFSEETIRMLELMASQIAVAANNSILYEDTVLSSKKMLARNRIVSTLTTSLLFEDVFDTFAAETKSLADYDRLSIATVADGRVNIIAAAGDPVDFTEPLLLEGSVAEWVMKNSAPRLRPDLGEDAGFAGDRELEEAGFSSSIELPLVVKSEVIGTLGLYSRKPGYYNRAALEELQPVADQLALALDNQRLFRDVTQAKAEWEKTFDAAGEGIVVVDDRHRILRLNKAAARMLGGTVQEFIGQSCRQKLHHIISRDTTCTLEGAMPGSESFCREIETPDGKSLEVAIDAIFSDTGKYTGGVHFMRDISESKQMRQRLLQTEKMVAVGQLVSGVAHEINNPLTGITGYAQLLMGRDDIDEKTRRDIQAIASEAERATRIVRQLLSFARKHQSERRPVKINDIIEDSIGLKGYDLKVNNITVNTNLDRALPDIAVDPHQIQQVFLNLITNAEQAMLENGKSGVLEITTSREDEMVRITFSDNGPGIPEEIHSRLFDPFFTTKDVGKGTGLGLSVCYGIVQDHGGNIWAEKAPEGGGAEFVVEFPMAEAHPLPSRPAVSEPEKVLGHILLVDDEKSVREVLAETLRRQGHEVDIAEDGESALRYLGSGSYDCVVSDVRMPGMSGADLHLAIRSVNPELAGRFIFISGDTVNDETREYLEKVPNPALAKPFSLQELEAELQKMLAGKKKAA